MTDEANRLHAEIMNLPFDPGYEKNGMPRNDVALMKLGHRDARHAAAELVLRFAAETAPQDGVTLTAEQARHTALALYAYLALRQSSGTCTKQEMDEIEALIAAVYQPSEDRP